MVLIVLNFLNWGINLDILKINIKIPLCSPKQVLSAKFEIRLLEGGIKKYLL